MSKDSTPETNNQAAFEALLEALKWRVVRRENDRVIIERVETGEQGQLKQIKEMRTMAKTTNEYMEEVHTMAKFSDDYEDCLLITQQKDNNISIIAEEVQRGLAAQLIFSSQKARKIGEHLIVLANKIEGGEQ
jgi:hypothetical protein